MKPNTGFTLLELMIVISIIAVLAAASTPNIISWFEGRKLSSASRDVLSAIQAARLRAVKERANAVVIFDLVNDTFEAFVDNGAGGGTANNNLRDGSETLIKSGSFTSVAITGGPAFVAFTSRGFANAAGTVTLQDGSGTQKQITVSTTGSSEILH
ncbi:MAG: GspH/FimT family pseudopilin [Deltaproteobacteria bacterium]|nr:GspH/FimT family pseudopilin [Deltaproteobacteria bacterium]MBW2218213.1 GspH/FimT family pseudopilin [Deltaproteobacteria bacterium]